MRAVQRVLVITIGLGLLAVPTAAAAATGGAGAPTLARITAVRCMPTAQQPCAARDVVTPGGQVRVHGRRLASAKSLVFRGRPGRRDDVKAPVQHLRSRHFEAVVPASARTGRVQLVTRYGAKAPAPRRVRVIPPVDDLGTAYYAGAVRRPSVTVAAPSGGAVELVRDDTGAVVKTWPLAAAPQPVTITWDGKLAEGAAPNGNYTFRLAGGAQAAGGPASQGFTYYDHVFPIRGTHDLGQSETNNFGGGRDHQGQDMFAPCGTPLVAARGGRVRYAGYHRQAGNYVVITSPETGLDYVYMHMQAAPLVETRETVATGQPLGEVGDSGNASGCHTHFELWTAPGWYEGGSAIDPLPRLQAWDGWS